MKMNCALAAAREDTILAAPFRGGEGRARKVVG